ncbi:heterokaryon incompatibility protein-domain-containing protein [Xylaria sp. FL0933]|nr:heterokaryon incompatibility protein-domain-containing protein [Xylaria sp. FL0933]
MGRAAVRKRYRPPWKRWNSKHKHTSDQTECFNRVCSCSSSQSPSSVEDVDESGNIDADNGAAEPYSYSELNREDDIRILQLLPGQAGDPIQIQVQHVSMSTEHEYAAISYAWGNRMALRSVFCEGKFIQVPINLSRALTHLRHTSHPIPLWVDAICINQQDEVEKSRQVRRMRTIFMKARRVTIWLGQDIRQSAKGVFETMDAITKQDFENAPPPEDIFWRGVERLFRKQWFSRLWCLQEVILAADADIQWGTEVAPWKTVAETATWIRSCPVQLLRGTATQGANNAHLMYILGDDLKNNKLVSFLELLALSWQFRSSDMRDKVYGLLGIPTTDSDPSLGGVFVQPDYTKDGTEVYRRSAAEIIRKTQSLRILLHVQMTTYVEPSLKDLPSWVPRWHSYYHPMMAPSEQVSSFNACGSLPASLPRVENDTLFAKGRTLSRVRAACLYAWDLDYFDYDTTSVIEAAWHDYLTPSEAYETDDERLKAWPEIPGAESGDAYRFDLALRNACQGRKLLLTDDGHVGLGPAITQEDDIVCILSGLVMPIILRRTTEGYQVVGEAYVHGIMFGEVFGKPGTTENTELEEFSLH